MDTAEDNDRLISWKYEVLYIAACPNAIDINNSKSVPCAQVQRQWPEHGTIIRRSARERVPTDSCFETDGQ